MTGRLAGKTAIITGGARGMGAATSRLFAEEGANVVVADLLVDEGEALASEYAKSISFQKHDVTQIESWRALTDETSKRFGKIDILVNNAGVLLFKTLLDTSLEEYRRVLDINLTGQFLGIKAVAPLMIKQDGGSIVNISSVDGTRGSNGLGAYASSKWGIRGLTRVAAMELGHQGIRVNSVHPGGIDTVMANPGQADKESVNEGYKLTPMQRIGDASEIAATVLFLASDESSYFCGSELVVDGGLTTGTYYPGFPGAPEL